MKTDENIKAAFEDMQKSINHGLDGLPESLKASIILNRMYILGKFELWMREDLERLGLI